MMIQKPTTRRSRGIITMVIVLFCSTSFAQDIPITGQKRIFFPIGMDRPWQFSIGLTSTTMPSEITEELRLRVPALDLHLIRRLGKSLFLDTRVNAQGLQNLVTMGPRWVKPLNDRLSIGLGNDIGFWFGFIKLAGLNTEGRGWQSYPNLSFGYRFNKSILFTFRAESILNFGIETYAGDTKVESQYSLFSGSAFTVMLEQPFFKNKSLSLGFRAIYSSFYWQTWTLFESFERNIFFPQVIAAVIL